MNKYWEHFKIITKHKWIVFNECRACGLLWQGLIHDLSKYNPIEFFASAKYFQGDKSPIDAEKEKFGYSLAWNHHKGHNPHHWEYWIDFDKEGNIVMQAMPYKYIIEMVCDWVGAGKVYSSDSWTSAEPFDYYMKTKESRYLHPQTEKCVESCLFLIKEMGLEGFHDFVRRTNVKKIEE